MIPKWLIPTERMRLIFIEAVSNYVVAFCLKHDFNIQDAFWVNDDIGEVLNVNDFYFTFDVVRYDIDNKVPEHLLIPWYESSLENSQIENGTVMSYPAYHRLFGK